MIHVFNDKDFDIILKENIESQYINKFNYKYADEYINKIMNDYINRFHPELMNKDCINIELIQEISELSIKLFEKMKPVIDWDKILNHWKEMNDKIDYRINVEHNDYIDDLDQPPTEYYSHTLTDRTEFLDTRTEIFMTLHNIPDKYYQRVREIMSHVM